MAPKIYINDHGKQVLNRIRRINPFIQGSLTVTMKRCGNPRCRCASQGPIHETALLTWKEGKLTKTLYVPVSLRKEVAKWVEEGKLLKKLINEMSEAQRSVLQTTKAKKKV